jgi:uncharacterized metal-binding protein YceD (DUF177 family)
MNELIAYKIPYAGLKNGLHSFVFQADNTFFAAIPDALIQEGSIKATMTMDKTVEMMVFQFEYEGSVTLPCDRCLDDYEQNIKGESEYIVKFADREYEEDEIIYITNTEGNLNVAHFLYESIVLELPTRRIHQEGECNSAVVSLIAGESSLEANADGFEGSTINEENPFAKVLKDFNVN